MNPLLPLRHRVAVYLEEPSSGTGTDENLAALKEARNVGSDVAYTENAPEVLIDAG